MEEELIYKENKKPEKGYYAEKVSFGEKWDIMKGKGSSLLCHKTKDIVIEVNKAEMEFIVDDRDNDIIDTYYGRQLLNEKLDEVMKEIE